MTRFSITGNLRLSAKSAANVWLCSATPCLIVTPKPRFLQIGKSTAVVVAALVEIGTDFLGPTMTGLAGAPQLRMTVSNIAMFSRRVSSCGDALCFQNEYSDSVWIFKTLL